ncbi:hypothetical protein K504DRAFT_502218 [Pleomassaria siparia CBS 279.74]|uniref:NHL repeat-containing protein n=1 Tax=Pleomassaria siparia CBS 279.74 TaxID=1314801 RepID=A0A6G1KAK1_9PLEO|nr:hypothetical protein K504DRAFT_502218 [Pleomassaria siparia CBS 279.74]
MLFQSSLRLIRLLALLISLTIINAFPVTTQLASRASSCADVNGTFVINEQGLYPENANFDAASCQLYLSVVYNASVAVYDPYLGNMTVIEFANITRNPEFHIDGAVASPYTSTIFILANAAAAFTTQGQDVSGTNMLLQLDPVSRNEISRVNLTETTQGAYGGFQDLEFDMRGNVYVLGTFPGSIVRVEPEANNGTGVNVVEWWKVDTPTTTNGMAGLATFRNSNVLLANDNAGTTNSSLVKFDMTQAKGTPVPIPISNNRTIAGSDAMRLPVKYNGTVLLVAVDVAGIEVLRSKDGTWDNAEGLGLVSNNVSAAMGGSVTNTVEIGNRILMVEEFFADGPNGGNRTQFPFVDITDEVDRLVIVDPSFVDRSRLEKEQRSIFKGF